MKRYLYFPGERWKCQGGICIQDNITGIYNSQAECEASRIIGYRIDVTGTEYNCALLVSFYTTRTLTTVYTAPNSLLVVQSLGSCSYLGSQTFTYRIVDSVSGTIYGDTNPNNYISPPTVEVIIVYSCP